MPSMSSVPPDRTLSEDQPVSQQTAPLAGLSVGSESETGAQAAIQLTAMPPPVVAPHEALLPQPMAPAAVVDANDELASPSVADAPPVPAPEFGGRLCAVPGCANLGTKLCGDLTWFDCATCDRVYCAAHSASGWKESPVGYRCANVALCTNHKSSQCVIL